MNNSLRNVSNFSGRAACRYRVVCFVVGFMTIAILAVGCALILAFDESTLPPTYTFEFTQDKATPDFFNPFVKLALLN